MEQYIGNDLKSIAKKHAENIYIRKIQKISKKNSSAKVFIISSLEYQVVQKSKTKLTVKRDHVPLPLPWGGFHGDNTMSNTCTVDNVLMAIHVLLLQRYDIYKTWKNGPNPILKIFCSVHDKFKVKKFNEGKHIWLKKFFELNTSTWDCYGSTYDFSLCKIPVSSTYKSTCNNKRCGVPVTTKVSPIIGYIQEGNKSLQT